MGRRLTLLAVPIHGSGMHEKTPEQSLGKGLRLARLRAESSTEDAAKFLGVHPDTLRRWERGDAAMPAVALVRAVDLYHTSLSRICEDGGINGG